MQTYFCFSGCSSNSEITGMEQFPFSIVATVKGKNLFPLEANLWKEHILSFKSSLILKDLRYRGGNFLSVKLSL